MTRQRSDDHLILYASCIPVRGFSRSIIYDLQRCTYIPIPNSLCEMLEEHNRSLDLSDIEKNLPEEDRNTFKEYVDFLIKNDLAFFSATPDRFFPLEYQYETPSLITNAILNINHESISFLPVIIEKLNAVQCQCIELRFLIDIDDHLLHSVLSQFNESLIYSIVVIGLGKSDLRSLEDRSFFIAFPKVSGITLYNKSKYEKKRHYGVACEYINTPYIQDYCGIISHRSMLFSLPFFMEAQYSSPCLNKKIFINESGYLKNCPMSDKVYGNILNDNMDLGTLALDANFNFLARIKKDDIEICRNCEFRYACPDCRIFRINLDSLFSFPQKCKYNPFIGKWEGENGYRPITEFGTFDHSGKFISEDSKIIHYFHHLNE